MLSLYPANFLQIKHSLSPLPGMQAREIIQMLSLTKFFLRNAELTIRAIQRQQLNQFDPLVRDSQCQRHALVVLDLFHDDAIKEKANLLRLQIVNLVRRVTAFLQKPPFLQIGHLTLNRFVEDMKIDITIDRSVRMLLNAHLLTYGSSFQFDAAGNICYQTDYSFLHSKLCKTLAMETVKEIVRVTRSEFSINSAYSLPEIIHKTLPSDTADLGLLMNRISVRNLMVVDEGKTRFETTSAFFTMEAVLMYVQQRGIPILIKEHRTDKRPLKYLLFHEKEGNYVSESTFYPLDKSILVIKGEIPDALSSEGLSEKIHEIGLKEIVRSSASLCRQFNSADRLELLDPEAQEQLFSYRKLAKILGCANESVELIKIVHVYASTLRCEKLS